jgi:16S rRNA (uracil1498-N3)-methyltransferase
MGNPDYTTQRRMSTLHRFFVPTEWIQGDVARIESHVALQVFKVLRLSPKDRVVLLDDSGFEYHIRLESVEPHLSYGVVEEKRVALGEPHVRLRLYQAVLKGDKFDLVLQKGTEIGVSGFIPIICQRTVPRGLETKVTSRLARWRRIVTEAAEQSHRGHIPDVSEPLSFSHAVKKANGLRLILWENEVSVGLRSALRNATQNREISIFIGPEGGFAQDEIQEARSTGITPVSLGTRILRAETAGMATAVAIMYQWREFGSEPPISECHRQTT